MSFELLKTGDGGHNLHVLSLVEAVWGPRGDLVRETVIGNVRLKSDE